MARRAGEVLQQVAEALGADDAQIEAHAGVCPGTRRGLTRRRPRLGVRAGLGALTCSMTSSSPSAATSASGSGVAATMSRSLTLSAWRRTEPASTSAGGCARSRRRGHDLLAELQRVRQQHARGARLAEPGVERARGPVPRTSGRARAPCAAAGRALPRAARRASRCRARRGAGERAWGRGRAAASARPGWPGTSPAASRPPGYCRSAQRQDLLLQRLADAGQLGRATGPREGGHRGRRVAHRSRRVAVGHDAMHDRAVELVEVAELIQGVGDRRCWTGRSVAVGRPYARVRAGTG